MLGNRIESGYNVVYKGIGGRMSNHENVITWSSYGSQKEFEEFLKTRTNEDEIVAQGVDSKTAIDWARSTPVHALIAGAVSESTDEDGKVSQDILGQQLATLLHAHPERITEIIQEFNRLKNQI